MIVVGIDGAVVEHHFNFVVEVSYPILYRLSVGVFFDSRAELFMDSVMKFTLEPGTRT